MKFGITMKKYKFTYILSVYTCHCTVPVSQMVQNNVTRPASDWADCIFNFFEYFIIFYNLIYNFIIYNDMQL